MQNQNQSSFTLRLAQDSSTSNTAQQSAVPTLRLVDGGNSSPTIDLAAAYRSSRMAAHHSLSSMRFGSSSLRGGYFRRAG